MNKPLLKPRPRLGDLLVRQGFLTADRLQAALKVQSDGGANKLLGEVLIEHEFCTEEQVLECLAIEFRLPFVRLDALMFDPKVVELLPRDVLEKNLVLPLFKLRDTLTVAVAEPSDIFLLDRLKSIARCEVQLAIASARDIRRALQTNLSNTPLFVIDNTLDDVHGDLRDLIEESLNNLDSATESNGQIPSSSVSRLVNFILTTAVKDGASDIHLEPTDRHLRVRVRVDGALFKSLELPSRIAPAIVARIKSMAALDCTERRLPQDGCIHVMLENRSVDLRVSLLPLAQGEKTVIRILDNRNHPLSLSQLGFSSENLERFQSLIHKPNGMVLVTGPMNSGKSTTLAAALNSVSSLDKNICTVEDPIEFQLPLINQFPVNEKIGLTFSTVLNCLMRQDPDIVLIGEIRDAEIAQTAVQMALSGHFVFSSLHTDSACGAAMRLINMGIEGDLIGAALNGVLAQRLCRRICAKCKQPYEPSKAMLATMRQMGLECSEFFRGVGCAKCRNTGYSGRIAIHELLVVDDALREAFSVSPTLKTLTEHAQRTGMIPLRFDGLRKVREGLTTIEEVLQVRDGACLSERSPARAATPVP